MRLSSSVSYLDRLGLLLNRFASYPPAVLVVELLFIWMIVYAIVRFVQGTRAAGAMKGVLVFLVFLAIFARVLGQNGVFERLALLYDRLLAFVAIGLIVIFQPELRRAVVRLGETSSLFRSTPKDIVYIVDEISEACAYFARAKFGAIIVIERQTPLSGLVEGGAPLNATLSSRLLQTIFFPGSALHDLAVIMKGRVILAAGVQLPLAEPADMPDASLGSRHRAAVGVSRESDAVVVVVSEETGLIRIAERGRLTSGMSAPALRVELASRLASGTVRNEGLPDSMPSAVTAAESPADASLAGFEMHDEDAHEGRTRA